MENNNGRVLAYTLAKEVSHEELHGVAGSGAGVNLTQYRTLRATGSGQDIVVDFRAD
ncbi:MAG: hypothetical protein LCH30_10260 [Proteobacteria bacterium]|nr:hypothetical protein [Pseudomonadota bacterium]